MSPAHFGFQIYVPFQYDHQVCFTLLQDPLGIDSDKSVPVHIIFSSSDMCAVYCDVVFTISKYQAETTVLTSCIGIFVSISVRTQSFFP